MEESHPRLLVPNQPCYYYTNARKVVIVVGLEPYIFRVKVGGDNLYTTRSAEKGSGSLARFRTSIARVKVGSNAIIPRDHKGSHRWNRGRSRKVGAVSFIWRRGNDK